MNDCPVKITHLDWLTPDVFEVKFQRPADFEFVAGQKIRITYGALVRDYSLVNAPRDNHLLICVRLIPSGDFTPILAKAKVGQSFQISEAFGYFAWQSSERQAVFVATGTGIAPFVAYVRSGVQQFHLLHGVRSFEELYYRDEIAGSAKSYVPCISQMPTDGLSPQSAFAGRVTDYLHGHLPIGAYDFYLSGRGEMVRDVLAVIDQRFDGSRVYTEVFF